MLGEFVVDASVAAKLYFIEEDSALAFAIVRTASRLVAPDLLFLEIASIGAKRARRGEASLEDGMDALKSVANLLTETAPSAELAERAFFLAATHGFSAYDAAYIALAETRGLKVLTADARLIRIAARVGLGDLVQALAPEACPPVLPAAIPHAKTLQTSV